LSHEEQNALSEAIGGLPENLLQGVVEILQNAGAIPIADDIELDLELEELDTSTLRELQRFVHEVSKGLSSSTQQNATTLSIALPSFQLDRTVDRTQKSQHAPDESQEFQHLTKTEFLVTSLRSFSK